MTSFHLPPANPSERETAANDATGNDGQPLLAAALFVLALLLVAHVVWGAVTYSGLYRWLADLQGALFGGEIKAFTFLAPIVLIVCPLFLVGGLVLGTGRRSRQVVTWLPAVVGLLLALVGVGLSVRAAQQPTLSDPVQTLDVVKLGDQAPQPGHVLLVGRAVREQVLAARWRSKTSEHEDSYTPIVANSGEGGPVRYVTHLSTLDPQGPPTASSDNPEGILRLDALPPDVRASFKRAGVALAPQVHLLSPMNDQGFWDWVVAVCCLLAGLLVLGLAWLFNR